MEINIYCPNCHIQLSKNLDNLLCKSCKRSFNQNSDGFYLLLDDEVHDPKQKQDETYVKHQETYPIRVYKEFLRPLIQQMNAKRLLDVGCGLGMQVHEAVKNGYDAYGVDLPNMTTHWKAASRDPMRFISCSAVSLPFPDNFFDLIWSLGVVEHIGTADDTATLIPEFETYRANYAKELLRVTKPGGKIIVSCPNKTFPIDLQHGPTCGKYFKKLRWAIFNKTGLNIHKTWGQYHLLSYAETKKLFDQNEATDEFRPLPLHGYFGFNKFQSGYLRFIRNMVIWYVSHLPPPLLATFLNPYMLVQIGKKKK